MMLPRWRNTKPAPAEMMIAIAAITAKAANRLPLTPKRGRKNPKSLPIPNRNAMPNAPSRYQKTKAVQYRVTRLRSWEFSCVLPKPWATNAKEAGDGPASLSNALMLAYSMIRKSM